MLNYMKKYVEAKTTHLSNDARNLLYVAYKNIVGSSRAAWRVICSIEDIQKESTPYDHHRITLIKVTNRP